MVLLTTIFIVGLLAVSLYGCVDNDTDVSVLQTVIMSVGVVVIGLAGLVTI